MFFKKDKEKILCSAIHYVDDYGYIDQPINVKKGFVICGFNHNVCRTMSKAIIDYEHRESLSSIICGYITNRNRFVNKIEAKDIAREANQISRKIYKINKFLEPEHII
jgi:hypothetical protein